MYFVQLELKNHLPVEPDKLLHLFYFIKHFFGKGTNPVIPTLELVKQILIKLYEVTVFIL